MLSKEIYRIIEYYLYNYKNIDQKIREIEETLTTSISYSANGWIKSKNRNISTVENQAIKIADNRKINTLKKWQKIIHQVLEHYKKLDTQKYQYIELKYFKKYNYKQIQTTMYIDSSVQARTKKEIIYYLVIFAYKAGLITSI